MTEDFSQFEPRGFVKFRQSKWFKRVLFLIFGPWVFGSIVYDFDPGMSWANFCLSFEASLAACFILEDGAKQLRILIRILRSHGEMIARIEARDRRIERLLKKVEDQTGELFEDLHA